MTVRIVHYVNQFFGQIGGEDHAGIAPMTKEGPVGPGMLMQNCIKDKGEVVATVICGDNYFVENETSALTKILEYISSYQPDVVVAGPAFNAGRYGTACGAICKAVQEKLGIPAVTGMYIENPGLEIYQKYIYCVETSSSASGMRESLPKMATLALMLAIGVTPSPTEGGYLQRGLRQNQKAKSSGAERAVNMLLAKMGGEYYQTEIPLAKFDRVPITDPIKSLSEATIALVTEGGLVPSGNPDKLESSKASNYYRYSIENMHDLIEGSFQSVHGGYNTFYVNQDPDRLVPVDILRDLESNGYIGKLHNYIYTTSGNQTSLENSQKFGRGIAQQLRDARVSAVILTST